MEVINTILAGRDWPFAFLVENQWWPGFTFTEPEDTARLLDGIRCPKKGIMLDTGHLMNANTALSTQEEGAALFLRAIPFNFYPILAVLMVGLIASGIVKDYGPMKKHEDNAAKGDLYTTEHRPYADTSEMKFNPNGMVIDLVIPVVILIVCCVGGLLYAGWLGGGEGILDMFANTDAFFGLPFGATIALVINMIYFAVRRSMKFTELMDCLPEGFKQMVPAILILCMAWTISGVTRDGLGAPEFVAAFVEQLGPGLHNFLPAVVFLIACFNTCVGLISCCGTYFAKQFPRLSYRSWAAVFAGVSMLISIAGLDPIIALSTPILQALYPVAIVLILLSLLHRWLGRFDRLYPTAVRVTGLFSVLFALDKLGLHLPGLSLLPLSGIDLGWVLPACMGVLVGLLISHPGH